MEKNFFDNYFEVQNNAKELNNNVEILQEIGVNIRTTNTYVINQIRKKFDMYFNVNEGKNPSFTYSVYADVDNSKNYNNEIIQKYFDKYGQDFTIHLGHNEGENRYGKKITCGKQMYALFLYSNTLVKVDYNQKSIFIKNVDEKKLALDVTRIIKDGILQRLLEAAGWKIFHAGFAKYKNEGYLLLGDTGSGKTTLLLGLCSLGATLVSNDRVFIHSQTGSVLGWPEDISVGSGCISANTNLRTYFQFNENENMNSSIKKQKLILRNFNTVFSQKPESTAKTIDHIIVPQLVLYGDITAPWTNINEKEMRNILEKSCLSPYDPEHPHWLEMIQVDAHSSKYKKALIQTLCQKGRKLCFRTVNESLFIQDN